jgi:hypothetical protein
MKGRTWPVANEVKSNAGEAVNRAAQTSADREPPRRAIAPAFEHVAFPVGLGFVAGFVDVFGFMA